MQIRTVIPAGDRRTFGMPRRGSHLNVPGVETAVPARLVTSGSVTRKLISLRPGSHWIAMCSFGDLFVKSAHVGALSSLQAAIVCFSILTPGDAGSTRCGLGNAAPGPSGIQILRLPRPGRRPAGCALVPETARLCRWRRLKSDVRSSQSEFAGQFTPVDHLSGWQYG